MTFFFRMKTEAGLRTNERWCARYPAPIVFRRAQASPCWPLELPTLAIHPTVLEHAPRRRRGGATGTNAPSLRYAGSGPWHSWNAGAERFLLGIVWGRHDEGLESLL